MSEEQAPEGSQGLREAEQHAIAVLDPELRQHGLLSQRMYNLIGSILSRAPQGRLCDISQSRKVATSLLIRLQNDLRCSSLLALRGYPDQACTLVASVYEAAMTIGFLGADDLAAQEWIDHEDPNRPFKNIQKMTLEALRRLGAPDPEQNALRNYTIYRQLCMSKHLNPLFQKQRVYEVVGQQILANNGPDTSQFAVRIGQFVLEKGIGFAFVAAAIFAKEQLRKIEIHDLFDRLGEISRDVTALNQQAAKRWGTENPYPDRWKI